MIGSRLPVSVAMCTYNGERFLPEQLASIVGQTRTPDELVICDDASSDSTPDIVNDFSRSAPFPVQFIRNAANLGSTKNFEQAISLCRGGLIALCDQDDIWLPEKLARQADVLERDGGLGGVFSDAHLVDNQSKMVAGRLWASLGFSAHEQKRFRSGQAEAVLLRGSVVTGATLMFQSHCREMFMPIPDGWVHDAWIAWMVSIYSRLTPIGEPLIQYRIHRDQQVGMGGTSPYAHLPLRERFAEARRKEPEAFLSLAVGLEELAKRTIQFNSGSGPASRRWIVNSIEDKAKFLRNRANLYTKRSGLFWIIRNMWNYHRFERGWKYWIRDIALLYQ